MSVGKLGVEINSDESSALRSLDRVSQKMRKVGDNMSKFGAKMSMMVTLPIIAGFAGILKSAMDLEATEAKFNTVFGDMADEADAFLKKFRELTPATKAESRSMASGLQDLMIPMGIMREEATKMTGEFMHVTGALANFNSGTHTAEQVAGAMQSALVGQYESLNSLGIQLNKTKIQNIALESGMADSKEEITKAMEAQILLDQVYAQSGDALAAYTYENLDATTKLGLFKAGAVDAAQQFGVLLLPALNKIIDAARAFTKTLENLSPKTKALIMKVGGIVAAIGPAIFIIGKLTTAVAMFASPVGIVIGVLGLLAGAFTMLMKHSEYFRDFVTAIFESVKNNAIRIFNNIKDFVLNFIKTFKAFWEEYGESIMRIVITAFETVKTRTIEIFTKIKDFVLNFIETFKAFWTEYGDSIVTTTVERFTSIYENIKEYMTLIYIRVEAIINSMSEFIKVALEVIQKFWDKHGESIMRIVTIAFDAIKKIIDTALKIINDVVQAFTALFSGDWETFWAEIKSILDRAWQLIVDLVPGLLEALGRAFLMGVEILKGIGKNLMEGLWEGLKAVWEGIKKWVDEKLSWLKDAVSEWWNGKSEMSGDTYINGDPRLDGGAGGKKGPSSVEMTDIAKNKYGEESLNAFARDNGVDVGVAASMMDHRNVNVYNTVNAKTTVDDDEMKNIFNEFGAKVGLEVGT